MPSLSFDAKNQMLNALSITEMSLHSAYDASGGNELVGGTPPYARVVPTFPSAVNGVLIASSLPYSFNVPAGSTVAWLGLWSATTFIGMTPNGGGTPSTFVVTDPVDGTLHAPLHGFNSGDTVVAWKCAPLAEGTLWTVTVVDADNITVLDQSSAPPTFTIDVSGFLQLIIAQDFVTQGTFPVNSFAISADIVG